MEKFLLNTIILPLGLQLLVFLTWRSVRCRVRQDNEEQPEEQPEEEDAESAAELAAQAKASRWGDYYFAYFLTCALHAHRVDAQSCVSLTMGACARPDDDAGVLQAFQVPQAFAGFARSRV